MQKRIFFIYIFLFAAAALAQNVQVGNPAPDFTLNRLNGGSFSLGDYAGQVRFLNFFGST